MEEQKSLELQAENAEKSENENSELTVIPPQYEGMPSEIVENLWDETIYTDEEKTKEEKKRREKVLEEIRQQEQTREEQKSQDIAQGYAGLSEQQKKEFTEEQAKVVAALGEQVKKGKHDDGLSREEQFIMSKLESVYDTQKQENPDKAIVFGFEKAIDEKTYENLVNRIAIENLRKKDTQERLDSVRKDLGINLPREQEKPKEEKITGTYEKKENQTALQKIDGHLKRRLQALSDEEIAKEAPEKQEALRKKKAALEQSFNALIKELETSGNKTKIASILMSEQYHSLRSSDYDADPLYADAWQFATTDKTVDSVKQGDWIYRGIFPSKSEGSKTETRGSLNINVGTDTIKELDDLIKRGVIKANYKIGDPASGASAFDRHDAVTIYFLEQPSEEAKQSLSDIAKKHFRGNDLLGKKISDGFYMSEVGSVSDKHASEFIQLVSGRDKELGDAVLGFLKNKNRIAMSEAQFYAVKAALNSYGIDCSYDAEKGFSITTQV